MPSQSLLTFELFSVMVHSGSAAGGHYYACIKSFSDGQWYSFNDQHVSKVSHNPQSSPVCCRMTHQARYLLLEGTVFIKPQFYVLIQSVHFCWTDHPRWYQEDIWWILREQRLLLQCLCKVGCASHLSVTLTGLIYITCLLNSCLWSAVMMNWTRWMLLQNDGITFWWSAFHFVH